MNNSQFEPLPVIQFEDEYPEMQDRKWKRYSHAEFSASVWGAGFIGFALGVFATGFIITSILL